MTTVNDILTFMETVAPQAKKESWDNVGLSCGRRDKEVRTILVALDPFEDVAEEAVQIGADLIVTHHPLLFHPAYAVTGETAIGRTLITLIRHDIAAFSAHTNLDIAPEGVGHCLAKALQLQNISVIDPQQTDADGGVWGLLRRGTVDAQPLDAFLSRVKQALHTPVLRYAPAGEIVRHVAVGGGACADEWKAALDAGCDTFVTSDARYNDFWDARDAGLTLIDAGHFYTENPVCAYLQRILRDAFPEVKVELSRTHGDCMKFF